MKYQMIATDLDGTLLNDQAKVDPRDAGAVICACRKGLAFVLATGRPYDSVQETLKAIGLYNEPGSYVISYNGGAITENRNNRLLYLEGITYAEAAILFEAGLEEGLGMRIYTLDGPYHYGLDDAERAYLKGRMEVIPFSEPSIEFLKDHQIVKFNFVCEDFEQLNRLDARIRDRVPELEKTFSSGRYMEYNRKGVSKAKAIGILAKKLGFPIEKVIAVGDNFNDLPMIEAAGLGICVANAVDAVKEQADVTLEHSNNDAPMKEIIEKYVYADETENSQ